jgi:hypothetical protein
MSDLLQWAQATFAVVEQDAAHVAKVRLLTTHDNEVWHTWERPLPEPSAWVAQADAHMRSMIGQFPRRNVGIVFEAQSAGGEVLSRLPWSITGTKAQGNGSLMGGDTQAAAAALEAASTTIERLTRLTNTQLELARKTAETNAVTMAAQSELIKLMQQARMAERLDSGKDELVETVKENLPQLLQLGQALLEKWKPRS